MLTGPLPPLAIPARLQDFALARLDRLAPAKQVAQIGAAIGREFSSELLPRSRPLAEDALEVRARRAGRLGAGLPPRHRRPRPATRFKHALVQDAAYQSLLKSRRQQLHARIAEALGERVPRGRRAEPEVLAHHCTEAGLVRARPSRTGPGRRLATARSANAEAVGHLESRARRLERLPEPADATGGSSACGMP